MYAELGAVAARQYGLLLHDQLTKTGLSNDAIDGLVAAGWLNRIERGLYRVAGAPTGWRQALMAGVLAAGPYAAASHEAAGALWQLPGFPEGVVEVSTPFGLDHRFRLGKLYQSCLLPREHLTLVDGIAVTRPARTLFDLAATVGWKRLERAANNALAMKLVAVRDLRAILAQLGKRGRTGTRVFRLLVEKLERSTGHPESGLEADFLEIAMMVGLPEPELQVELGDADGFIGRVDTLWRPQRLIIEVDSDRFHTAPLDVEADEVRDARLRALGFKVRRFSEHEVKCRKQRVAAWLRSAILDAA